MAELVEVNTTKFGLYSLAYEVWNSLASEFRKTKFLSSADWSETGASHTLAQYTDDSHRF